MQKEEHMLAANLKVCSTLKAKKGLRWYWHTILNTLNLTVFNIIYKCIWIIVHIIYSTRIELSNGIYARLRPSTDSSTLSVASYVLYMHKPMSNTSNEIQGHGCNFVRMVPEMAIVLLITSNIFGNALECQEWFIQITGGFSQVRGTAWGTKWIKMTWT